jgi:hypothetical protein
MFSAPFLVTLLDRVKAIVRRVAGPPAERAGRAGTGARADAPMDEPISPEMRGLAYGWMSAKVRALSALMRRIETGKMSGSPARPSRTAMDVSVPRAATAGPVRLPRGFGWMCGFGPDVRRDGQAFADLLNGPMMKAMVLAAPEQMAPLIGPILAATGEAMPEWFPTRARKVRRSRAQHAFLPPIASSEWDADAPESGRVTGPDAGSHEFSSPPALPTREGNSIAASYRDRPPLLVSATALSRLGANHLPPADMRLARPAQREAHQQKIGPFSKNSRVDAWFTLVCFVAIS